MRIAFCVGEFPTFSETFIFNQISGLLDRGHEVEILAQRPASSRVVHPVVTAYRMLDRTCYQHVPRNVALRALGGLGLAVRIGIRRPALVARGLNVRRYGLPAASFAILYAARRLLPGRCYDIIHAHFGPAGNLASALRELGLLEGKLVTTFHGFDMTRQIRQFGERVYDRLLATGDLFLPISDAWRTRLLELGAPPDRTVIHHMGINTSDLRFSPRTPPVDGPTRLVTVARLAEKKGIDYAIRAVAAVVRGGRAVEYRIAGDGPLRAQLERLVEETGMRGVVQFLGARPQHEVRDLLADSHVMLAPSVTAADGDQEGIPVVLMEAMATGMPVVSTMHSGIPELVEHGRSGYLVPERDLQALTDTLDRMICEPAAWAEMGAAGRARVEREFDIHRLNDELVERFCSLIGNPAGPAYRPASSGSGFRSSCDSP